jgi:hypothetical protein
VKDPLIAHQKARQDAALAVIDRQARGYALRQREDGSTFAPVIASDFRAPRACTEEDHARMEHAVPCTTDGPLGHGWECGRCGAFLQAG